MLNSWNNIYNDFNPVAFHIFSFSIHWYGIAYVMALFVALYMARFWVKKNPYFFPIDLKNLDYFFIWAEVGVILGARLGYIIIYEPQMMDFLIHPWRIFDPFDENGHFIGIRGMSYHGGLVGFLIASFLFARRYHLNYLMLLDLIALSVPLAYIFGRIGNFLNQELFGRVIQHDSGLAFMGIMVDGVLRYPSQLIEAFLEGFIVFLVVLFFKGKVKFYGALIAIYGISYSIARFVAEFFREPDFQLGTYFFGLSMGQILSFLMCVASFLIYIVASKKSKNYLPKTTSKRYKLKKNK